MHPLPRPLPAALIVALTLGAAAAVAQPATPLPPSSTYKSVGPDGKIIFSDRKPTDPQLRTRELGQRTTAPLFAPATGPYDLRPSATPPAAAPALEAGMTPALDASGKPFPRGLPDAILDVVVHQFFVQSLVETCVRVRPAFADRYQGGVRNWRDRSADILARSNRITFTRFTGEQRDALRATARARLAQLMPAPDASDADKAAWCDRRSNDLARRQFELVGDMRVAPILYFEAPWCTSSWVSAAWDLATRRRQGRAAQGRGRRASPGGLPVPRRRRRSACACCPMTSTRSGRVIDTVTGAPVVGASVVASWSGFTDAMRNQQAVAHVEVAVTDADGRLCCGLAGRARHGVSRRARRTVGGRAGRPGRRRDGVAGIVTVAPGARRRRWPAACAGLARCVRPVEGRLDRTPVTGSGEALVPLQLALIAGMEHLAPDVENRYMLAWARQGLAATREVAGAVRGR